MENYKIELAINSNISRKKTGRSQNGTQENHINLGYLKIIQMKRCGVESMFFCCSSIGKILVS